MPNNKKTSNKQNKQLDKASLIYFAIFTVYFLIAASAFIYSIKFLSETINSALSEPQNEVLTEEYASLKLKEYSLISQKLGLSPVDKLAPAAEAPIEAENASSSSEISETAETVAIAPKILILNSTQKPGLATKLKTELENSGLAVLRAGNNSLDLDTTTIKIKDRFLSSPDFTKIKNVVSENYTFIILPLEDDAEHDIEIVIGNN